MERYAVDFGTSNTVVARWNYAKEQPQTMTFPAGSRRCSDFYFLQGAGAGLRPARCLHKNLLFLVNLFPQRRPAQWRSKSF